MAVLKAGSTGTAVGALQKLLAARRYYAGKIDGDYGPMTTAAVLAYQQAIGFPATGEADDITQVMLGGGMRLGSRGPAVKELQTRLTALGYGTGGVDGKFGEYTLAAVAAYQVAMGLDSDGIVGPLTWASILAGKTSTAVEPRSEHFTMAEFNVHNTAWESIWENVPAIYYGNVQKVMDRLEQLRALANTRWGALGEIRIIIRSGYRGKVYNAKDGGADGSMHLTGSAADVYAVRVLPTGQQVRLPNDYQLAQLCNELWPSTGGYGLGSNVNLHIDIRTRRTIWWYTFTSWAAWMAGQGAAA